MAGKYSFSDKQDQRREDRRPKPKPRAPLPRATKPLPKATKPLPKESARRKRERPIYRAMVKEMFEKDNRCELQLPGCTGIMEGADHTQKRSPSNYIDKNNLKRACNHCNLLKEKDPELAKEKGVSTSRFAPMKRQIIIKNLE